MKQEFVPYELAVKLKQLGFDEECIAYYDLRNDLEFYGGDNLKDTHCVQLNTPLFQQAFRFFRNNYQMQHRIVSKRQFGELVFYWDVFSADEITSVLYNNQFKTYEEAEFACLEKIIEIVETFKQEQ